MKLVVAFALCAAAASAAPSLTDVEARLLFSKWMKEHGKYYETGEEQAYRLDMFKQVRQIDRVLGPHTHARA